MKASKNSSPAARPGAATAPIVDVEALHRRFVAREATIGVIGLGYVGLPLVGAVAGSGFTVLGFDIDAEKVAQLNAGRSYIRHIPDATIGGWLRGGRFHAVADFTRLHEADAVLICVPTPLTRHREPDLTYIVGTTEAIAPQLRRGQLIVLESTTYPGTTREVMQPILERGGLKSGVDFFLAYSPEREDPGRRSSSPRTSFAPSTSPSSTSSRWSTRRWASMSGR